MKSMVKNFIALLICMFTLASLGDVLLWQVNESTTVDNGSIQQFLVPYPTDDDHFPGARVKLVSSDGTVSTILKIWGEDPDTHLPVEWDGTCGVEPGNWGSGRWETGWVHSETGYNTINTVQGQLIGTEVSYPPEVMESLFIMELGYNSWDESVGDYVWQTLAQSAPELYKDLVNQHMYASGDIAPPGYTPWSPNFYTVPEPNSFILLSLGICLLGLKRRR